MIQKFMNAYCRLLSWLMVACLATMVVMVFGNVVMRYGFNSGITESEELSRWLFVWIIFMGAIVAVRERAHMGTEILVAKLPKPMQQFILVVSHLLMLFVTWLMFKGSVVQTQLNWESEAPVTGLSQAWLYAPGVVFAVSSGMFLLMDLVRVLTGKLTLEQTQAHVGLEPTEADLSAHRNSN